MVGWAFSCKVGKKCTVEGGGSRGKSIVEAFGKSSFILEEVSVGGGGGQGVQVSATVERVDVGHHSGVAMDSRPVVSEKFLCPTAEHMAWATVSGNFVDGVAVTDPPEAGSPNIMVDDAEGPSASGNLADKRVVVGLSI